MRAIDPDIESLAVLLLHLPADPDHEFWASIREDGDTSNPHSTLREMLPKTAAGSRVAGRLLAHEALAMLSNPSDRTLNLMSRQIAVTATGPATGEAWVRAVLDAALRVVGRQPEPFTARAARWVEQASA